MDANELNMKTIHEYGMNCIWRGRTFKLQAVGEHRLERDASMLCYTIYSLRSALHVCGF